MILSAFPFIGWAGLSLAVLFAAWPAFRRTILARFDAYDAFPEERHWKTEAAALLILTIAFGALKYGQTRWLQAMSWDHSMILNVSWNIAHGDGFWNSLWRRSFLADHFSPVFALFAPPHWFGRFAVWPLWVQTLAMMGGVALIARLARGIHPLRPAERLLMITAFSLNLYFQRVHRFEFHAVALAIPLILGLYLLARSRRWGWFYALLPVALFGIQEDVPLMALGLGIGLAFDRGFRKQGALIAALSAGAFWVSTHTLLPHFAGGPLIYLERYQTLVGESGGILTAIATRPWLALKILFSPGHAWELAKLFASFGFLPLLSPSSLAALVPPILQQSLSDYWAQYRYGAHYSANALPFLMIGTLAALSARKFSYRWLIPAALAVIALSGFKGSPYFRPSGDSAWTSDVWRLADTLPKDAAVCAQGNLLVPFSFRRGIFLFPDIHGSDYIVLAPAHEPWPLQGRELAAVIAKLRQSPNWTEETTGRILVFKRK